MHKFLLSISFLSQSNLISKRVATPCIPFTNLTRSQFSTPSMRNAGTSSFHALLWTLEKAALFVGLYGNNIMTACSLTVT